MEIREHTGNQPMKNWYNNMMIIKRKTATPMNFIEKRG